MENCLTREDWHTQWAQFAKGFDGEYAHIPLVNGQELIMHPGPGFGDASHPTTQMMLEGLQDVVYGKQVVDVGCGSGILSIASSLLGAKGVFGIDIDEGAILHSKENLALNPEAKSVQFSLSLDPEFLRQGEVVFLMNMISSEQKLAWPSLQLPRSFSATVLVSGILLQEKDAYLSFVNTHWNFSPIHSYEHDEWLSFLFLKTKTRRSPRRKAIDQK